MRLVALFSFILASSSFAATTNPGISDVLERQQFSVDWGIVSLISLAFSFTIFFIIKSVQAIRSVKKTKVEEIPPQDDLELNKLKSQISFISAELKRKTAEEEKLRDEVSRLEEVVRQRTESEEVLRRTIDAIKKENQKASTEKEKLNKELSLYAGAKLFDNIEEKPVQKPEAIPPKKERNFAVKKKKSSSGETTSNL